MCGIIGYVGSRTAKPLLLQGLSRLEYRGYDSAGIALREDDALDYVRAVGNLDELKAAAGANGSLSTHGLGHTRWATHGAVTELNAQLNGSARVLLRRSGTEPLVRLLAEAQTEAEARRLSDTIAALVLRELG